MQKWQLWLNSFNTPGGNLLLLFVFVVTLLGLTLRLLYHPGDSTVTTVILTTFSGFSGALMKALSGRTSDVPPPPGNTSSTATTSHVSEAPPESKP
jgi:hypothetical protein